MIASRRGFLSLFSPCVAATLVNAQISRTANGGTGILVSSNTSGSGAGGAIRLVAPTTSQPSIMVTSIGGVPVTASPTGSFTVPDVTLKSTSPLTVNIQGTNVQVGTTATVYFTTENFPSQKITSTPLTATNTPGITTATASVTLNPGWSLGYITATWAQ